MMSTLLTPFVRWRHENGPNEGRLMVHRGRTSLMGRRCQKVSRVRPMAQNHPQMERTRSGYLLSWSWCCRDLLKVISCMPLTGDRFLVTA